MSKLEKKNEYLKELEGFIKNALVGEILFEKKPNGDIFISKRETRLIKKGKESL